MKKMNKLFGLWTLLLAIGGSCNAMSNSSVGTAEYEADVSKKMALRESELLVRQKEAREEAGKAGINIEKLIMELWKGEYEEHNKLVAWLMAPGVPLEVLLIKLNNFGETKPGRMSACCGVGTVLGLYLCGEEILALYLGDEPSRGSYLGGKESGQKLRELLLSATVWGKRKRAELFSSTVVENEDIEAYRALMDSAIEIWNTSPCESKWDGRMNAEMMYSFTALGKYMGTGEATARTKERYEEVLLDTIGRGLKEIEKSGKAKLWMYLLANDYIRPYLLVDKTRKSMEGECWEIRDEVREKMIKFMHKLYEETKAFRMANGELGVDVEEGETQDSMYAGITVTEKENAVRVFKEMFEKDGWPTPAPTPKPK
jgi:hypothetical protein